MVDVENPVGIEGIDFVEYAGPDAQYFLGLFNKFGFKDCGYAKNSKARLFEQGQIRFFSSAGLAQGFAAIFAKAHGPSICATGFRVKDANDAFKKSVARGARPYVGPDEDKIFSFLPAVYGIGDSLIYFVDEPLRKKIYADGFGQMESHVPHKGFGFDRVDHFTNNVFVGEMDKWSEFYEDVFNFKETRFFNIRGKQTGLYSKVMRSPCGQFSIPINEPTEGKSQIQEYLDEYKGSGIQHLALITSDITETIKKIKASGVDFLTPPPSTYYKMLKERLPAVQEDVNILEKEAILVDGDHDGYLLQIFTKNLIGPIFFEVIERKNHAGFGEGNFQALFDAIERDQVERGYL